MTLRRRRRSPIMPAFLPLLLLVLPWTTQPATAQVQCTLCADGSPPNLSLNSETSPDWTCANLATFASILTTDDTYCQELQFTGYWDCECPTYPEGYCTLCPAGSNKIPDKSIVVPSSENNTCGEILFVEENRLDSCDQLAPFRGMCGCPTEVPCTFCADGSAPVFADRIIPYLTTPEAPVTCASNAARAFSSPLATCADYTVAPVPVDGQAYCGCQGTAPANKCSLCPEGSGIVNPQLVVPRTGGLTCQEMEGYLRFVTDEAACSAMASMSQPCCQALDPCPVCPQGPDVEYERELSYPPYGMTCESIGLAQNFGYKMGCADVQQRFPYYCGCPDSRPACTLCPLGQPPPLERDIPLLGTTCSKVNAFASLRLASECAEEIATLSFDASAYCGCDGFQPPDSCQFCAAGQVVRDLALVPPGADQPCEILQDFARYVTTEDLCAAVKDYASICCVAASGPTIAPFPTMPTSATIQPTTLFTTPPAVATMQPSSVLPTTRAPIPAPQPPTSAARSLSQYKNAMAIVVVVAATSIWLI